MPEQFDDMQIGIPANGMNNRFLHIGFDSIFFDRTIEQFETIIPGNSDYVIDLANENTSLKYIKNKHKVITKVLSSDFERAKQISEFLKYRSL